MIRQFRLENFKGHRDTDLMLERFTVLVGDNGSGKTSVLEALQLPGTLATHAGALALNELLRHGVNYMSLSFAGATRGEQWTGALTITAPGHNPWGGAWELKGSGVDATGKFDASATIGVRNSSHEALRRITSLIGYVGLYRFRADQVAAPAYSDQPGSTVAEDGAQTAVALAALKLADDATFNSIENALRRIVPSLNRVFIKPATVQHPSNPNPVTGSKLYFDFQGAKGVPAHHASQGTLVALALLTVLYGRERPSVILLDDFDHALHPRAQMELVRMIKELLELDELKETQIIATTHSPYVLDEVSPSNVIAFALRDDGTVASKPLSAHPDAPKVNGALKSGELWSLDGERAWVL